MILTGVIVISGYYLFQAKQEIDQAEEDHETYQKMIYSHVAVEEMEELPFTAAGWQKFHDINPDFIGWLEFDSGVISQPVVQGEDDNQYLRRNMEGEYSGMGTVFMEAENKLSDQNLILYGHNVYIDETAMFSPLQKITDQGFYEENRSFRFYLEDRYKQYDIFCAYYFDTDDYNVYDYQIRNFQSRDQYSEWITYALKRNTIQSDAAYSITDRYMTFQTCKAWDPDTRIIVLAVEKEEKRYSGG